MDTLKDYEKARIILDEKIKSLGLTLSIGPVKERPTYGKEKWSAAHYRYTLVDARSRDQRSFTSHYSTGYGNVARWAVENMPEVRKARARTDGGTWKDCDVEHAAKKGAVGLTTFEDKALRDIASKAYRPTMFDIVSSMLSDCSDFDATWTLREFCEHYQNELGMEFSNPCDAIDLFEAIRAEYAFLSRVCGTELEGMIELSREL